MLPIFVVNLESSDLRREKVSRRLEALSIPFEIFQAVDGRQGRHALFERHCEKTTSRFRRKPLSGGELGCFASHFLLWEKCVELDQPIVVMEDDVYVANQFGEAVEAAESLIAELGYIRLAGTSLHRRPYQKLKQVGPFDLVDHIRGPSGTLCYVIHPNAAKRLIEKAHMWCLAVDDYMDRYWHHGVDCFSLMPFQVLVADNGSDIQRLPKAKVSVVRKLRRELNGRAERLRRNLYRLKGSAKKKSLAL